MRFCLLGLWLCSCSIFSILAKKEGNSTAFRFVGPEVLKLDWNARALHASDVNGDGLNDLAIVNRDRSRIEILYRRKPGQEPKGIRSARPDRWEPLLENAPYVRENLPLDGVVTSITTGDLDGDGKEDIVFGGPEDGVYVCFRRKDNSWSDSFEVDSGSIRSGSGSLDVRDLDGDGKHELLVFAEGGLEVFRFKGRETSGKPLLFHEDSPRSRGLNFADLNGDGSEDWIYLVPGVNSGIRTRIWTGSGFGPESSHEFASRSLVNVLPRGLQGQGVPSFVAVEADTERITLFSIADAQLKEKSSFKWSPLVYDLFGSSDDTCSFEIADFDGDGHPDLVATSSAGAELLFLRGLKDGDFSKPSSFPSLRGISSLASGRIFHGDKKSGLVLVSVEEKLAGVTRFSDGKRLDFPQGLQLEEEPVEVVCADLDANGLEEILLIAKERYDYRLHRISANKDGKFVSLGAFELKDLKRDPKGLFPCDLDGDGNLDLLILVPRGPAILLAGDGKGKLVPVAESSAVRKSMLADLDPSKVGFADVDLDSTEDLLVSGNGFVRAIKLENGQLEVIDQFNSRTGKGNLLTPFALNVHGDAAEEILFYSSVAEGFEALSRDSDGVFRYARSFKTGALNLGELLLRKVHSKHELLAFGKRGFFRIPTATNKSKALTIQSSYLTDLRDVSHAAVDCGDFDSDGILDLLCLDPTRHLLEFLRFDKEEKEWKSVLRFNVFERNLHYQGKKGGAAEPREGLVADLNGDKKDDFALLAHDRLLLYYQE